MTGREPENPGADVWSANRIVWTVISVGAGVAFLRLAHLAGAVAALVAMLFAGYVALRVLVLFEHDRFSPSRLRVGMTWALTGINRQTNEYDIRPVRVYFVLLALLFAGLVVRPLISWIWE